MMKRSMLILLCVLMCTAMLYGCNNTNDTETPTSPPSDTGEPEIVDDGIGTYNFGGEVFSILARQETSYEHIGEMGSDAVSQAVYSRNAAVEDRFGVIIETLPITGGYDDRNEFVTAIRAEHMAPTGAYDLVSTHSIYLGWFGAEGILADLSTLPEIDLTKEYWNQNLYNELNIDGSCYIMIGDIGHTLYEYISVMFVNTDILTDNSMTENGIDGLYDMVENGTWTWEALYNLAINYGVDAEETYGLLMNTHSMRSSMIAQNAGIYKRNEDGRFYLPSEADEHLINAVQNLSKFFSHSNMFYAEGWYMEQETLNPIFTQGKALFYGQILGESAQFSAEMGDGYAVLPLPKYDEFQSDYYTICCDEVTAVAVMSMTKDKKMSGVITQALCMYGSEYVTPEYYEKALKYRYANDPRCPEILEKIRASLTIEAVPTFYETGIDSDMFREIVRNGRSEGVASQYAEYPSSGNTLLQNFYLTMEILKD